MMSYRNSIKCILRTLILIVVLIPIKTQASELFFLEQTEVPRLIAPEIKLGSNHDGSIAKIKMTVVDNQVKYQFISNRNIDEFMAARWEERFLHVYPILFSLSIDIEIQKVELVLPSKHTREELLPIIQKFNYDDFEIID